MDATGFHGRDAEIKELLGRLRAGERETYVIGRQARRSPHTSRRDVTDPRLSRG